MGLVIKTKLKHLAKFSEKVTAYQICRIFNFYEIHKRTACFCGIITYIYTPKIQDYYIKFAKILIL